MPFLRQAASEVQMAHSSAIDRRIRANVLDVLRHDPRLDDGQITADVVDRVVYLRGVVPTVQHKGVASRDVSRIKGVRAVVNDLTVTRATSPLDLELAQQLRARLAGDHRILQPANIFVWVENGEVTLLGSVRSCWERLAAAEDARALGGVRRVLNQLVVALVAPGDDQEIRDAIWTALRRDARLEITNLAVQVARGVVELRGKVPSREVAEWIIDDVWCVPGVRQVVDRLAVGRPSSTD